MPFTETQKQQFTSVYSSDLYSELKAEGGRVYDLLPSARESFGDNGSITLTFQGDIPDQDTITDYDNLHPPIEFSDNTFEKRDFASAQNIVRPTWIQDLDYSKASNLEGVARETASNMANTLRRQRDKMAITWITGTAHVTEDQNSKWIRSGAGGSNKSLDAKNILASTESYDDDGGKKTVSGTATYLSSEKLAYAMNRLSSGFAATLGPVVCFASENAMFHLMREDKVMNRDYNYRNASLMKRNVPNFEFPELSGLYNIQHFVPLNIIPKDSAGNEIAVVFCPMATCKAEHVSANFRMLRDDRVHFPRDGVTVEEMIGGIRKYEAGVVMLRLPALTR